MKHYGKKLAAILAIVAVLTLSFFIGGNAPGLSGVTYETFTATQRQPTSPPMPAPTELPEDSQPAAIEQEMPDETGDVDYSVEQGMDIDSSTGTDAYHTEPVPEGKPVPVEAQDVVISEQKYTCTLSITCGTILENLAWLDPEKRELVPEDGVILPKTTVTFYEGESVFNLLLRETRKNRIHMEYMDVPFYNSAYIEGIANLYEFDCGELSGWMYRVNDWFPNYGCSRYQLKNGDKVEWIYTCTLGRDVNGVVNLEEQ